MCPRDSRSGLAATDQQYGDVATAGSPFGLGGWVHLRLATDVTSLLEPGQTVYVGGHREERQVEDFVATPKPRILISGCSSRADAEALRGSTLAVDRQAAVAHLEGRHFWFQIEGLEVETEGGEPLGRLVGLIETGANDVYEVSGPAGELLIPALPDVIRDIDLKARRMIVALPAGLRTED